jgi:hypothetical protein
VSYARLEEFAERFSFQLSLQVLLCRSFLTGIIIPVSLYLQADKSLFSSSSCSPQRLDIPPEELSAEPGEKDKEKKEVTEVSGSPLSVFSPSFP